MYDERIVAGNSQFDEEVLYMKKGISRIIGLILILNRCAKLRLNCKGVKLRTMEANRNGKG